MGCRKFILLLLFILLYSSSQSQIDSLKSSLTGLKNDTSRVRLLGKIAFQYFRFDTDSGIVYAEQAIALARELHWDLGLAFSYNYLGINYGVKGNYPKALECFQLSLARYEKINDHRGIALVSNNLGNFYRIQKKYREAISYVDKAILYNTLTGNQLDQIKSYINAGAIYSDQSILDTSDSFYYKAFDVAEKIGNKETQAGILINLADNMMQRRNYCKAIEMGKQAVSLCKQIDLPYYIAQYQSFCAEIILKAIEDTSENKMPCRMIAGSKKEMLNQARTFLDESSLFLKSNHDQLLSKDNLERYSRIFENLGDYQEAMRKYKSFILVRDSLFSKDNSIKITELEKRREIELRDKQIQIQRLEIEKKNFLIYLEIIIFILILVLVIGVLNSYNKRKQLKRQIMTSEELRRAKEKAEESDRLKSAFLANLSHEIRTPMNTIMGFSKMLKDVSLPEDERLAYIDVLERSGLRLVNTIGELVDISRIQTGQVEIFPEMINVGEVFIAACNSFDTEVQKKGLEFIKKIPEPFQNINITTDKGKLRAIITHLVRNSVKYTQTGLIETGFITQENGVLFYVRDTGIGIPADRQEAIFNHFEQADIEDVKAMQGTGLGLSISKAYVELLGGKIWVESREGEGSLFQFTLPLRFPQYGNK